MTEKVKVVIRIDTSKYYQILKNTDQPTNVPPASKNTILLATVAGKLIDPIYSWLDDLNSVGSLALRFPEFDNIFEQTTFPIAECGLESGLATLLKLTWHGVEGYEVEIF